MTDHKLRKEGSKEMSRIVGHENVIISVDYSFR